MASPFKEIYIFQSMTPEVHLSICFHLNQLFTEFGLSGHSKESSFSDRTSGMTVLNGCLLTTCWERVREQYDKTWMSPSKTMLPTRAGESKKKYYVFWPLLAPWHFDTWCNFGTQTKKIPKTKFKIIWGNSDFFKTFRLTALLPTPSFCMSVIFGATAETVIIYHLFED